MALALCGNFETGGFVKFLKEIDVRPIMRAHAGVPSVAVVFQPDKPHECVLHAIGPTTGCAAARTESAAGSASAHAFRAVLAGRSSHNARCICLICDLRLLFEVLVRAGIVHTRQIK